MPLDDQHANFIASIVPRIILYIPKKITTILVERFDKLRWRLTHPNVACAECPRPMSNFQVGLSQDLEHLYERIQDYLSGYNKEILRLLVTFFEKITPSFLKNFLQAPFRSFMVSMERLNNWINTQEDYLFKKSFLPALFLIFCVSLWGIGILPEVYAFVVASIIAGKILNVTANLISRHGFSDEWHFLRETFQLFMFRRSFQSYRAEFGEGFMQFINMTILELSLVGLFRRVESFVSYCTNAFFSWLVLYVLVKFASDQTPTIIDRLEHFMDEKNHASMPGTPLLENVSWLILYESFQTFGSNHAIEYYQQLHYQGRHTKEMLSNEGEELSELILPTVGTRSTTFF